MSETLKHWLAKMAERPVNAYQLLQAHPSKDLVHTEVLGIEYDTSKLAETLLKKAEEYVGASPVLFIFHVVALAEDKSVAGSKVITIRKAG